MTADEMEHDHLRECSGLYALGALAPSEQAKRH